MEDSFKEISPVTMCRFQILHILAQALMFNGSQFFYSIPFYQLYPALNCYNADGKQIVGDICTRENVCMANGPISKYSINYNDQSSLYNWMTNESLGLLCAPPYVIGFIGSISFISFSIGSIVFTRFIDKAGRKPVIVYSGAVTPIGLLILLLL
jgi:MFS family permease